MGRHRVAADRLAACGPLQRSEGCPSRTRAMDGRGPPGCGDCSMPKAPSRPAAMHLVIWEPTPRPGGPGRVVHRHPVTPYAGMRRVAACVRRAPRGHVFDEATSLALRSAVNYRRNAVLERAFMARSRPTCWTTPAAVPRRACVSRSKGDVNEQCGVVGHGVTTPTAARTLLADAARPLPASIACCSMPGLSRRSASAASFRTSSSRSRYPTETGITTCPFSQPIRLHHLPRLIESDSCFAYAARRVVVDSRPSTHPQRFFGTRCRRRPGLSGERGDRNRFTRLYGGAHLFRANSAQRLGALAQVPSTSNAL